jgi:stage III sporulation protein AF
MEFLRGWIINIVVTIILVIIIEIIMPGGSTRKYISLVTGLMVMFVIINPFVGLMAGEYELDIRVHEMSRAIAMRDIQYQAENLEEGSREDLILLYKTNLEQEMARQVINTGMAEEARVQAEINEDYGSKDFGSIIGIRALVTGIHEDETESGIQKVEKITVKVGTDRGGTAVETVSPGSGTAEEIKDLLAGTYSLPKEMVDVIIQGSE